MRNYCRNVRGNIISFLRKPYYKRTELSYGNKRIGKIRADNTERIRSLKLRYSL